MTERIRGMKLSDGNRRWWTLGAMCFALFMIMLDNTVVNVALPSIQRDLDTSLSGLEWTINAYTLSFAILLVTGGRLGDIFGRRKMFLFGVVAFGLSSLAISFSPNDAWLIAGRALQGIGAAFMMPATLSIISNAFPPEERGKAIGTWAGVSAIALAIGPLFGGFLVEQVDWRAIFYINVPIAVAAVAVTLWSTHESRDDSVERSIDVLGVVLSGVGIGALVLGLVEGNSWGWGSASVLGLFALSAVALVGFVIAERRVRVPMLDFSYFRSVQFLGANLVAFVVSFAMFGMFLFIALYMQNVLRYSPIEAGALFLPSTVMIMIFGPIAGRMADKIGPRPLMTGGLVLVSAALGWQSTIQVDSSYWVLLPAFVIMGVGLALVMSPMSTAAMNAVDRTKAGAASGVLSMSRMVGGTFGVAVIGALTISLGHDELDRIIPSVPTGVRDRLSESLGAGGGGQDLPAALVDASNQAYVYALSYGLLISAAFALAGAVLAWVLIAPKRPAEEETVAEPGFPGAPATGQMAAEAQREPARA